MKLVKAQENDINSILEMHNNLFDMKYTYDNYLYEISLDIANFMILKNEDNIIGYFITHSVFEQLEIIIIAIKEEYQTKGYGKFLLEYIEYLKVKNHCLEIIIEVLETNTKAIDFYERNGFLCIDKRKDYYGKGKDALIYIK